MQHLKRTKTILALMAAFLLAVPACGPTGPSEKEPSGIREYESLFELTEADRDTEPSADAERIDLSEASGEVVLSRPGDYVLSGDLTGRITVEAEEQVVHLFLNNVNVRCLSGPALNVKSAGKVIVTALSGTSNTFRDSGDYEVSANENACVYSVSDLTVNGEGKISVSGFYKDAVHSLDVVKILVKEIFVQAKRNGIRGNDGVYLSSEHADVQSEKDGIRTTKISSRVKGCLELENCGLSVISGGYALRSEGDLYTDAASNVFLKGILGQYLANGETALNAEGFLK